MKLNLSTISSEEAKNRGLFVEEAGYINTLTAEYGDPA